jgi:cytochrome c-type biogenesis protein CcmF
MFPVISEAAPKWLGGGEKVTVGPPFFNAVNVPIAIFLVFLTGVGPLLAWRKTSTNALERAFLLPGICALAGGVILFAMGIHHVYALISLVMAIFVSITISREFIKGALARASSTGENFIEAAVNLTLRNTRRYGGYIVHFGFVLLFIGWVGQAFTDNFQFEGGVGDTIPFHQYDFRVEKLGVADNDNYRATQGTVGLFENGRKVAVLFPETRMYKSSQQQTTEVSIRSTVREDVYLVFAGVTPDGTKAIFQVFINPLTMWVWFGGVILGLGTLIAMLPNKKSSPAKRIRRARRPESKESPEVQVGIT